MGFLSFLRVMKRAGHHQESKDADSQITASLSSMRTDINQLRGRFHAVDIALEKHHDQITKHQAQLQEHGNKLQTLEEKITETPAQAGTPRRPLRSDMKNAPTPADSISTGPSQQFDIDRFTEQQKRILAVFFQNKGVRMSYADVAAALNKSAYTVKNQINQIRQKADLFEYTIGDQSRKLFALKGDLRIEKYLKLGQPIERPASTPGDDHSGTEKVSVIPERASPQ